MKKRILSLALALCCLITAVPILALPATAAEGEEDTWTPTFRYVLLSDEHVNAWWNTSTQQFTLTGKRDRMVAVMKAAYAMAEKDGLAISALISGGDQVSAAMPMEYTELKGAFEDIQNLNTDTLPIYAIMGNHEYNNGYYAKNYDVAYTYKYEAYFTEGMTDAEKLAAFRTQFISQVGDVISNTDVNWTATIGGYPFVGLSIEDYDGHLSETSLTWLDNALATATKSCPGKPVFLICHMAVKDTVTYSDVSSCYVPESEAFQAVLNKYPSVILSTGHTHKSAIRPSAAWQAEGGFAAVSMPSLTEQAEFYMVEVDANNTVRYIPYQISGTTAVQLTDPAGKALYYEFAYGTDGKPTAQQYTATAQAAKTPAFATGATLTLSNLTAIGTVAVGDLRIPQALAGQTPADAYDITIQDETGTSQTVRLSATDDVWKSSPAAYVGRSLSLKQGATYTITVTPVSLFGTSGQAITLTNVETPTLVETKDPFFYTSSINWGSKTDANYPTFNATAGTVTFKNGWEMGVYKDGTIRPLDKCNDATAWNSSYDGMWSGHGGIHYAQNVAGYATSKEMGGGLLWQGYCAPYTGYLDLTISGMKMAGGTVSETSKTWYAVADLTTGEILWPQAAAGRQLDVSDQTGWASLEGTATIPEAVVSLRATAGDVIGVVVACASGSQWGVSSLAMTATYTHLVRSESVLHKDTFVQKAGEEGFPQVNASNEIVYSGAFTVGSYHKTSGYQLFNTANAGTDKYFYLSSSDMWATGGLFAVSKPGETKTTDAPFVLGYTAGYSTALVWTASRDGIVTVDLSGMKAQVTGQAYTIVRNFADGLLTGAFSGSFVSDEWIVCDADVANSTTLKGIQVKQGDTIALLLARGTSTSGWGMYDTTFSVSYTGYVQESTAAADVIPGAYKAAATSQELDLGNSGWDVVAYTKAADIAGQNPYLLNMYDSAELYQNSSVSGVRISANGNQLNYWGKSGALAIASGYVAGYRYTAKKSGTVAISLTELSLAIRRGDYKDPTNIGYAIYKNGVKVFPEGETAWYTVEYTTADNRGKDLSSTLNASLPRDLAVSAGDRIEVLATNQSTGQDVYNGAANVFFPCISYLNYTVVNHTAEKEFLPLLDGRVTVPDGAWSAVAYTAKSDIGTSSVQLIHTNGDNGQGGLNGFYTPGGAWAGNSQALLVPSSLNNAYWAGGYTGALLIASGTTAGYRYTAEQSGTVDLRLGTLRAVTRGDTTDAGLSYPITMEYAIYVNGQKIWPAAEGEWYSITYTADSIGTDYAAALNTFLPSDLYLAQGDRVEVLSHTVTTGIASPHAALATLFLPEVRYHSAAQVSVVLGGELALNIQPASDAETVTATWNGQSVALTLDASGRYTLGGILPSAMGASITLTWAVSDTTYDGVTISHTAFTKELTFADCLMQYVQAYRTATDAYGKAVYELAVATLNYGAAAQERFGDADAALPNKDLTEAEKAFALTDTEASTTVSQTTKSEGMTHTFAGVSLLLRDTVQLKLYVTGENGTSARIKYWTGDESQAQYCDLVQRTSTDPNAWKATIAVLPSAYAETYHFQIVDDAGNAVGTTLTYSVAAYATRVPSESEITSRLITMGLAAEAYLAAQNA